MEILGMFVSPAVLVVISVLIGVLGAVAVFYYMKEKEEHGADNNAALIDTFEKIRPMLNLIMADIVTILKDYDTPEELIEYSVKRIKEAVDKASFLNETEKALLSTELITLFVSPLLRKLWRDRKSASVAAFKGVTWF